MAAVEVKAWKCQNGHVMGRVVRNGSGVRRLLLYRERSLGLGMTYTLGLTLTPALSLEGEGAMILSRR